MDSIEREVVVLGDIELGGGTLTDDFIADKSIAKLFRTLARRKKPVDLILNGDTIDFLKCPYIKDGKRSYPRHITSEVSLSKLELVYNAHKPFFDGLQTFVKHKKNRVYFIIGNHDHDLFFRSVQRQIKKYLKARRNVFFRMFYRLDGIYVEHGQQYDFINKINKRRPFIIYKGRKILNIPWVSFGIISKALYIKEKHPFLERILPRPDLLKHHKSLIKLISRKGLIYAFLSFLYYPIRYFYDPTYVLPRELFREMYRRYKDVHWDVDNIMGTFKRKRKRTIQKNRIHILGHVHERYVEEGAGWTLIHPDTWRDEYDFDAKTRLLHPKVKRYVHIFVKESGELDWKMVNWPHKRKVIKFDDAVKDEMKYIKMAARAEGYGLRLLKK